MEQIPSSIATLRVNLAKLPKPLQDRICDDVLTITPGITFINHAYKPPVQLSIGSSTRESAAASFYGGSQNFKFNGKIDDHLFAWLGSLSNENLTRLQQALRPDLGKSKYYSLWVTRIVIRRQVYNIALWVKPEAEGAFDIRGLLLAKSPSAEGSYPLRGQPGGEFRINVVNSHNVRRTGVSFPTQ